MTSLPFLQKLNSTGAAFSHNPDWITPESKKSRPFSWPTSHGSSGALYFPPVVRDALVAQVSHPSDVCGVTLLLSPLDSVLLPRESLEQLVTGRLYDVMVDPVPISALWASFYKYNGQHGLLRFVG